jgi:hypothetical protein
LEISSPRNHVGKWRDYLRLLDGEAHGLSNRELAAIIFPDLENSESDEYAGDRRVRNGLAAGHDLRDRDWRLIPML